MYRAARALVIKPSEDLQMPPSIYGERLSEIVDYGITTEVVSAGSKVDLSSIDVLPDVVILDADSCVDPTVMADYGRRMLSSKLSEILPIVMVGAPSDFSLFDVNLHLDHRMAAHVIVKKLMHVIRIAAMKLEYTRRLETAALFGVKPPKLDNLVNAYSERLLVVGKSERYFQLASIFEGTATLKSVSTFEEARSLLENSSMDCLIIDSVAFKDFDIDELKSFKLDARFFSLPVLLLKEGLEMAEQEALAETGICDLFDLHSEAREIATYAKTLIHAEKMRHALLSAFKAPGFNKIRDDETTLPSRAFFESHLDKLVRQSQAWKTPIAFGLLDVSLSFKTAQKADAERENVIFGQIGQTIASLVRAEDMATYLGEGKFVIAAPNSSGLTISVLIGRISAVLSMTEYSIGGDLGKMDIKTNYFESRPQDTLTKIMSGLTDA